MKDSEILLQTKQALRLKHYSARTEEAYLGWTRRFLEALQGKSVLLEKEAKVADFLTYLAVERKVAASTQNQALNALVFLYKHVLTAPLGDITSAIRAKRPRRLPTVLRRDEVTQILHCLEGVDRLIAALLYGTGLRVLECLTLRVQDIDLTNREIFVRAGKGNKDRRVPLPKRLVRLLNLHLHQLKISHDVDLKHGYGAAFIADSRETASAKSWKWQWIFPADQWSRSTSSREPFRKHYYRSTFQKSFNRAVHRSGINKHATPHTLRHSYATHSLEDGMNIRVLQSYLGHASLKTTAIYLHITDPPVTTIFSPLK